MNIHAIKITAQLSNIKMVHLLLHEISVEQFLSCCKLLYVTIQMLSLLNVVWENVDIILLLGVGRLAKCQ